jgi:hypothetical protein
MASVLANVERILALKTIRETGPRGEFLAAIRELGKDDGDFTLERLRELIRIEEHFQSLLLYDQIDFLKQARAGEPEREFALNVQRICLEAANAFQRFLRNRNAWATTRDTLETVFRVTGLALNDVHCFVKWGAFLGESRAAPWMQIHALYALAETAGYGQVAFTLHASRPGFRPTVQSLYLRTLLLEQLNAGNLTKSQLEIADGWFASWCNDYSLDQDYSTRHHAFYVDLLSESGLHLMRKDSHGETIRYVRVEGLKAQIEDVRAGLRQGRLYAGYGAGALFPLEEHVAVLATVEKLYQSVVADNQNRVEERTSLDDRAVDVVVGVDQALRKMAAPPAPAAAQPDVEHWRVFDLSSKGFGLLVDRATSELVPLNGLIALRNQESGGWIAATVVRKLPNRVRDDTLIGVEVLSYRPIAVEFVPEKGGAALPAIYLAGTDPAGKLDSLIVRLADFHTDQTLVLKAGAATYRIRLNRIIRKGADWIKARFEIESKA